MPQAICCLVVCTLLVYAQGNIVLLSELDCLMWIVRYNLTKVSEANGGDATIPTRKGLYGPYTEDSLSYFPFSLYLVPFFRFFIQFLWPEEESSQTQNFAVLHLRRFLYLLL